MLSRGNLPLQGRYRLHIVLTLTSLRAIYSASSIPGRRLRLLSSTNTKSPRRGFLCLCSRQESNLERWYRKPAFYPLNYESKCLRYYHRFLYSSRHYLHVIKNQTTQTLSLKTAPLVRLLATGFRGWIQYHQCTQQVMV